MGPCRHGWLCLRSERDSDHPDTTRDRAERRGEGRDFSGQDHHQLRQDDQGNVIPRKIINKFVCRYNETVVFSVDLHEAISANPFFEFSLRATESGRLDFIWEEDGGAVFALSHQLTVG